MILQIIERSNSVAKVRIYTFETKTSWKIDAMMLLESLHGSYVFTWVEDHICIDRDLFKRAAEFCKIHDIDTMCYSFHDWGYRRQIYHGLPLKKFGSFIYYDLPHNTRKRLHFDYDHSLISIQKKEVLVNILKLPIKRFEYRLTPLEAEVEPGKLQSKVIRKGFFCDKFFVSVDDDHFVEGSCLIAQGEYPPYKRITNFFNEQRVNSSQFLRLIERKCTIFLNFFLNWRVLSVMLRYKSQYFKLNTKSFKLHFAMVSQSKLENCREVLCERTPLELRNTKTFNLISDDKFIRKLLMAEEQ